MDRATAKPLAALALAAFGIGTTEFAIMGLLPDVASDLGVTIPAAGLLVTGYALGVAFGGPLLALLTAQFPSRQSLFLLLGLFIAGNAACSLAPGYGWLMVARVVTSFCHAAFLGVGSVIAAGLVPPNKRAQAIALMIGGLTMATVLGMPLGTLLGQAAGWRVTFAVVTLVGLIAFAALLFWLPKQAEGRRDLRAELRAIRSLPVWLTLTLSVVSSTSMFCFFTYVTPILTEVSGVRPSHVSAVLLICGIGLTVGNFVGARLADWRALPSLAGILAAVALVLFAFDLIGAKPILAIVTLVLWGIVAFAVCAILQAEAVGHAGSAPRLAATLNISAFNLGNAFGAALGAFALTRGIPMSSIPALAASVAVLALALTVFTIIVTRRRKNRGICQPSIS